MIEIPFKKNGSINIGLIKKDKKLYDSILNLSKIKSDRISEHVYSLVNNIEQIPLCDCGKNKKFSGFSNGYINTCGSKNCVIKYKETVALSRYGHKHPSQSEEVKNKIRDTNLKKYGTGSYLSTNDCREKTKDFFRKNYGVENAAQVKEIQEKTKRTLIDRYGAEYTFRSRDIRNKIKKTFIDRYGAENPAQISTIKDKIKQTRKNNEFLNNDNMRLLSDRNILKSLVHEKKINLTQIAKKYSVDRNWLSSRITEHNLSPIYSYTTSIVQQEVLDFIKSNNVDSVLNNDRQIISPLEIDILVDNKLAIEINGIYYHSYNSIEKTEEKNRHLRKYEECKNAGLDFFSFTDTEWYNKKDIIKSIIKSRLGLSDRIYARKTSVGKIHNSVAKHFINENHLKGSCPFSISYGLFYNNEVVAVATFGKARYSRDIKWELIRLCFKKNINIIGGVSKLITAFRKDYSGSIVSYSDRDKFNGKSYEKAGFEQDAINGPGYYYWDGKSVYNRVAMQKHKLKNKLEIFDSDLSEAENCFNNGYRRYWNCGTIRWIMK